MTEREETPPPFPPDHERENQALKAIWEHFQGGDWGNALRVLTQYGIDQQRDAREERTT